MHEIEYTLTKKELIWNSGKIFWRRRENILLQCSIMFLFLLFFAIAMSDHRWWIVPAMIPFFAISIFFAPLYWARRALNSSRASFPMTNTLHFDKDGITIAGKLTRPELPWQIFVNWRENKDYFFLYTTEFAAVLVPKRAFTEEQMTDFRSCLNAIPDKTTRPI